MGDILAGTGRAVPRLQNVKLLQREEDRGRHTAEEASAIVVFFDGRQLKEVARDDHLHST